MALTATSTVEVEASPQEILEFVLDLESYREADHKITKVLSIDEIDEAGKGSATILGRMSFLPPAPDKQLMSLERWKRLVITGAPKQPARLVFDFTGTFECQPGSSQDMTEVTHAYSFEFKGPFRALETRLSGWLQAELDAEMARVREVMSRRRTA